MTQTEINQWEIDIITSALKLAHNLSKQGLTNEQTVREVFSEFKTVTSPTFGIYMPTELYEKMMKEGI